MLHTIYRHRVPGVIEARSRGVVKKLFIKDGNVVYARSSDLDDSLAAHLSRRDMVSTRRLNECALIWKGSNKRFGVILMEQGLLSPKELNQAIRQQVEIVAWSLFSWKEGKLTFDIQELTEPNVIRIQLPLRQMILRGIRLALNDSRLMDRLGSEEAVFEPAYAGEDLIDIALDREEYQLLKRVDGKATLGEIARTGPFSTSENSKILYVFHVLQLIRSAAGEGKVRLTSSNESGHVRSGQVPGTRGQPSG